MAVLPLVLVLVAACDLFGGGAGGRDLNWTVAVGDTARWFRVHVPDGLKEGEPARVVLAFHGSSSAGPYFQQLSGLDEDVDSRTITVYPNAAVSNWAEGCNCNNADRLGIDDLGFVEAMLDTVSAVWQLERNGVFAVGFSQGGLFAYRLACEMSDRFRAVFAVAAPMSLPLSLACHPDRPVSVVAIHGTADAVLPWNGTSNGALSLLSAPKTAEFWAGRNDCGASETIREDLGGGAVLKLHRWASCSQGRQVRLYELVGHGHGWPAGKLDASETISGIVKREAAGG